MFEDTERAMFFCENEENERKKNENELQMSEAFFSFRGIRGTFLIYVYIHFQYFPAEKLIVHVNGYSFRLSTKVCKENHSSQKRKAPLKNSLFHLVFTDVNTSFVHVVNSPLFSEQQKHYEAGLPAKEALNLQRFIKL